MPNTTADYTKLEDEDDDELRQELIPKKNEDTPVVFSQTKSIIFAILTGLFFAFHNFTLGSLAKLGYLARCDSGVGLGLGSVLYYIYQYIKYKNKNEDYFDWRKSVFRNQNPDVPEQDRYKFECWILIGIIIRAAIAVGTGVMVIISFGLALEGGMNQGIITAIFGMSPFIISIMFYMKFRETLKKSQLIGMVFMIVCIIMIGFLRAPSEEAIAQVDYNPSGVPIALILSIICPFFFALDGLVVRILCTDYKTDANEMTQAAYLFQGVLCLFASILIYAFSQDPLHEFIWMNTLQMVLAGLILNVGGVFAAIAVSIGSAGVAYSLFNTQVIMFILLAALLLGQIPTTIEIVAVIFGIMGSCIMSLGPEIYDKLTRRLRN
ncbi:unnamed protein product [Moneuplotes crassus]|uniref:EamA domain-containing protein n=1 Tax=Euplotes crassus TaxID=5936 RepID=A0AAD1UN71_EUPCR|nr:unnamed protein product [Moneuplotes crassus]